MTLTVDANSVNYSDSLKINSLKVNHYSLTEIAATVKVIILSGDRRNKKQL